ncbi:MAG: NAD(P)/FAD-dependent oxidoreductase, partial [Actinomycetota bacterium]
VLILGAGFGGLELSTLLSETLAGDVRITLLDQSDSFIFGFEKFDIAFGRRRPDELRSYYRDIAKDGVEFRRERVTSIDPETRRVTTDAHGYEADILVIALGADYDQAATPGFVEGGHEFYSISGAERLRDVLPNFEVGAILIAVLGLPFKCPPAPYEGAILLHDYFTERGLRDRIEIRVITPEVRPVPVSDEVSDGVKRSLSERGIGLTTELRVTELDVPNKIAKLADGADVGYGLFIGIPVHRVPKVVEASGLAEDGWIPVDERNLATRFPDVYAIGDVASAPVPRAGVFAERAAVAVADDIRARLRGDEAAPFDGAGICYIEFGGGLVARVDANFLGGRDPVGIFFAPSVEGAEQKALFASSRRTRWFGR